MVILRIEHAVPGFEQWKRAFDSDPVGRKQRGVRSYQVSRPVDDPQYVMIDLEFDTIEQAEGLLNAMRRVWAGAGGQVSSDQKARIVEVVVCKEP